MQPIFAPRRYYFFIKIVDFFGSAIFNFLRIFSKRWFNPARIKKILVIQLDQMGDMLLATPLVRNLKNNFPGAKLSVLCHERNKSVLAGNPYVDDIFFFAAPWIERNHSFLKSLIFNPALTLGSFFLTVKKIRQEKFDLGIDARGEFFNILLMTLGKVNFKTGYGIRGGGFMLDKKIFYRNPEDKFSRHIVERNLDILRDLNLKIFDSKLDFFIDAKEENFANDFLAKNGLAGKRIVVLHPGSALDFKLWQNKKWAELAEGLTKKGFAVILTCGPGEEKIINEIKNKTREKAAFLIGANLKQFGIVLKSAELLICLDSAVLHIAEALGVPTIALFSGVSRPSAYGPRNPLSRAIYKGSFENKENFDTAIMKEIEANEVLSLAQEILSTEKGK